MNRFLLLSVIFWAGAIGTAGLCQASLAERGIQTSSADAFYRLFGSAKEMMGDTLFEKADIYFHGGVDAKKMGFHEGETAYHDAHEHGDEPEPEHLHASAETGASLNWIRRINRQVKAVEDRHLEREEEKTEIMPFLAAASAFNPHNLEAILTTAYWLNDHLDKTDEAVSVLRRAIADNPDAWVLEYELGRMLFVEKSQYEESSAHLFAAVLKARGLELDSVDRFKLMDAHYYLARCLEAQGQVPQAVGFYEKTLTFLEAGEHKALANEIRSKIQSLSTETSHNQNAG